MSIQNLRKRASNTKIRVKKAHKLGNTNINRKNADIIKKYKHKFEKCRHYRKTWT